MTDSDPKYFFRLLTRSDGAAFRRLRLLSLEKDAYAFMSSFDAESRLHEKHFENHLDWAYHPPLLGYYGIFSDEQMAPSSLIGYAQLTTPFLAKQNHVGQLNNVYVEPSWRGKGAAKALIQYIQEKVHTSGEIEQVYLSCTASNKLARKFYEKSGFRRYGVKVKAVKWQDKYDDEVEYVWNAID